MDSINRQHRVTPDEPPQAAHAASEVPSGKRTSAGGPPPSASRRIHEGLHFLLEAYEYAADCGADVWEFALEWRELRSVGLTNSDLRWMVMKGLVEHARETTLPGDVNRSFRRRSGLIFHKRACFVLTPQGVETAAAAGRAAEQRTNRTELRFDAPAPHPPAPRVVPHWDADLQELRVNGLIVKQFKVPAPNQEMVLAAFEEENWPPRIDDPLPPQAEQDPKRRLHDTIVSLNRNHKHRLIRFMGDGSGEGVRWTLVDDKPAVEEGGVT